jgi:hypothetical protein
MNLREEEIHEMKSIIFCNVTVQSGRSLHIFRKNIFTPKGSKLLTDYMTLIPEDVLQSLP